MEFHGKFHRCSDRTEKKSLVPTGQVQTPWRRGILGRQQRSPKQRPGRCHKNWKITPGMIDFQGTNMIQYDPIIVDFPWFPYSRWWFSLAMLVSERVDTLGKRGKYDGFSADFEQSEHGRCSQTKREDVSLWTLGILVTKVNHGQTDGSVWTKYDHHWCKSQFSPNPLVNKSLFHPLSKWHKMIIFFGWNFFIFRHSPYPFWLVKSHQILG